MTARASGAPGAGGTLGPDAITDRSSAGTSEISTFTTRAGASAAASRPPLSRERARRTALSSAMDAPASFMSRVVSAMDASATPCRGSSSMAEPPPETRHSATSPAPSERASDSTSRRAPARRARAGDGRRGAPRAVRAVPRRSRARCALRDAHAGERGFGHAAGGLAEREQRAAVEIDAGRAGRLEAAQRGGAGLDCGERGVEQIEGEAAAFARPRRARFRRAAACDRSDHHPSMTPAIVAVMNAASEPPIIARRPSWARSRMRRGAMPPMPPSWMPMLAKLAKPHRA